MRLARDVGAVGGLRRCGATAIAGGRRLADGAGHAAGANDRAARAVGLSGVHHRARLALRVASGFAADAVDAVPAGALPVTLGAGDADRLLRDARLGRRVAILSGGTHPVVALREAFMFEAKLRSATCVGRTVGRVDTSDAVGGAVTDARPFRRRANAVRVLRPLAAYARGVARGFGTFDSRLRARGHIHRRARRAGARRVRRRARAARASRAARRSAAGGSEKRERAHANPTHATRAPMHPGLLDPNPHVAPLWSSHGLQT